MKPSLLAAGIYPRRANSGISSEMNMHATTTVWLGLKLENRKTLFLNKVLATPESITTILIMENEAGAMPSDILAKRIAVPLTIAIASLRKNQATRNVSRSCSRRARTSVFPSALQPWMM